MRNRIPPNAFAFYESLGPGRTYAAVAARFGVSVRGVTKRAVKEDWQGRLAAIEADARTKTDLKLGEATAAITERHLRTLRAVQHKALQALTGASMGTAAQASATLIAAVRAERAIVAPPSDSAGGLSWLNVVDHVNKAVARRTADEAAQKAAAAPAPEPVVPPALLPRVVSEN